MKQLVFALLAVALLLPVKSLAATASSLKIEDFTIKGGETKDMVIDLENPDMEITSVQFDLRLPEGLSIAMNENNKYMINIAGRTTRDDHSLNAKAKSNGTIRFLLASMENALLSGTSGPIISITLTAASGFNGGDIKLEHILLVAPDANATTEKPADYTYTVTTGVVQDAVTLTAKSYTRQYGEANPTFEYTVTDGTITSGTPTITCSATKISPVGTYPIVINQGSVSNSSVNLVNGTLTITKAPLTISAGNYTKVEGEANPTFTPTFSGFKNGETKSVLTKQPTVSTTATTNSPAGTYPVTVSGAEAQNYDISYVNGTLTVTAKPVVGDNITFADPEVRRICLENWDTNGDGELSKAEAAAVNSIGSVFGSNKVIKSFNEFQYFTGVKSIARCAFMDCSGLTSIMIPNSVTSIEGYAFCGCSGLTYVTIPNSVTNIGEVAFYKCSGINSITIPNSVTSIGRRAFKDTGWYNNQLDGILYLDGWLVDYKGEKPTGTLVIDEGTKGIAGFTFEDCSGLTSATIPYCVTSIGSCAFKGCSGLTSIKVESGNTVYDSRNNCNAIIETATNTLIAGCKNTAIPNSVTRIGDYAFYGCSGLTSVTIPNSVSSIGRDAFTGCNGLTSINVGNGNTVYDSRNNCNAIIKTAANALIAGCKNTVIPNSVTKIGDRAFCGCSGLTSVTIPNSVTGIGSEAFRNCSGLTTVTIGNSVTSIGNSAFWMCIGLTEVRSLIEEPFTINISVFQNYDHGYQFTSAMLFVPTGTKSKYEATDGWKNFTNIVEMEPGDVNIDGAVDVADIATVISVMATGNNDATADVNGDGAVDVADIATIISIMAGGGSGAHAPAGAEAVDLGLPSGTKWANMNVGAEKPEDFGLFFAWGETQGYSSEHVNGNATDGHEFGWGNYKWCNGSSTSFTKYCTDKSNGIVDNQTVLLPEDDAATANWGDKWRMPTEEEFKELLDNCSKEYVTLGTSVLDEINVFKLTSKVNGNSIILPASGFRYGTLINNNNWVGNYWSASLDGAFPFQAKYLIASGTSLSMSGRNRCQGNSVRAVAK